MRAVRSNGLIKTTIPTRIAYGHFTLEILPAQLIQQIQISPPAQLIQHSSWVKCTYDPSSGLVLKVAYLSRLSGLTGPSLLRVDVTSSRQLWDCTPGKAVRSQQGPVK